jgi:hypothetical protein
MKRLLTIIIFISQSILIDAQKRLEINVGYGINSTNFNVANPVFLGETSSGSCAGNQIGGTLKFRFYKNWYVGAGGYSIEKQYSFAKLQPFSSDYQNLQVNKWISGFEIPLFLNYRKTIKKTPVYVDFSSGLCFEAIRKFKETTYTTTGVRTIGYTEGAAFSRIFLQPKISLNYSLPKNLHISIDPYFNLDKSVFSKSITDTFIIHNWGVNFSIGVSL